MGGDRDGVGGERSQDLVPAEELLGRGSEPGGGSQECLREKGGTTRARCGLGAWPKWPRLDLKRRSHEKGPPRWRGGARRRDLGAEEAGLGEWNLRD